MENWKIIDEFSNYEVSDQGRVRSLFRYRNGAKLDGGKMKQRTVRGYRYVNLWDGKKQHSRRVARLVAQAFVPGDSSLTVDHIDGNKANNRASNLRWISRRENQMLCVLQGGHPKGSTHGMHVLTEKDVARIKAGEFAAMTQQQIGKMFRVSNYAISDVLREKSWKHIPWTNGYRWGRVTLSA